MKSIVNAAIIFGSLTLIALPTFAGVNDGGGGVRRANVPLDSIGFFTAYALLGLAYFIRRIRT